MQEAGLGQGNPATFKEMSGATQSGQKARTGSAPSEERASPDDPRSGAFKLAEEKRQKLMQRPAENKGALSCQTCFNANGDSCIAATTEECDKSVTRCISILTMLGTGNNVVSYILMKSCEKSKIWSQGTANMTYGEGQFYYCTAQTCQTDNCNDGPVTMPPIDHTENGKQCPQCYAVGDSCTPVVRNCVGQQTRCFKFHGGVFTGLGFQQLAIQGCTTENLASERLPSFPDSLLQSGYQLDFP